ncbi:MAG: ATP-binding protein [Thermodesulfobacteriota bacterium]|nr:ATP-binding protein [Thermodesulfobacteriota bacterium]
MGSKKSRSLNEDIPIEGQSTNSRQKIPMGGKRGGNRLSLRLKFLLYICLIIIPAMGIVFVWIGIQEHKHTMDQILNQARILAKQVVITRQWVSDCGGVMVDTESKGAENISCFFEDKDNIAGKHYRRFCPAMVTKKLSEYASQAALYRFHITSLDLLNPENKPNLFEEESLKIFQDGNQNEIFKVEFKENDEKFQYMIPLRLNKSCVKCHHKKDYNVGMIRGGLSVFFSINDIKSYLKKRNLRLAVAGACLIFITIFILLVLLNKLILKPVKELEVMANDIGKGNFEIKVNINTGDELETLGQAFNSMGANLREGRDRLKEKIDQATRDLREANKELQGLDKLKSDFLSNMSHELRTPLTVIRGGVNYLKRTIKERDKQSNLKIIDKNLNHLTHLVNDLFDFSRIEAGNIEWDFSTENIGLLLQDIIDMMRPLTDKKNLSVLYKYPGEIYVRMDLERIEQVLFNLFDNAVKFSNPGAKIYLKAEKAAGSIVISVKDQGIGIPREKQEYVFEKFYTLTGNGKDKNGSTGLGLAICKGIIEGHGGRIWVESEIGHGSAFYFSLPLSNSQLNA